METPDLGGLRLSFSFVSGVNGGSMFRTMIALGCC